MDAAPVVGVQVAVPWHMMKVPLVTAVHALSAVDPGASVQVPTTLPLLRVPVVVVVPFDVPEIVPVKASFVPVPFAVTVSVKGPLTVPALLVLRLAVPDSLVTFKPVWKQEFALKNEMPVMSRGPVLLTEKETTKFKRLACPVPLVNWTSQLPLVDVVGVGVGVELPQPQTAISSASTNRIARFLMYLPDFGVTTRIERCGYSRQWMYGAASGFRLSMSSEFEVRVATESRDCQRLHTFVMVNVPDR